MVKVSLQRLSLALVSVKLKCPDLCFQPQCPTENETATTSHNGIDTVERITGAVTDTIGTTAEDTAKIVVTGTILVDVLCPTTRSMKVESSETAGTDNTDHLAEIVIMRNQIAVIGETRAGKRRRTTARNRKMRQRNINKTDDEMRKKLRNLHRTIPVPPPPLQNLHRRKCSRTRRNPSIWPN